MAVGAASLCDRIGRRKLFITSTAGPFHMTIIHYVAQHVADAVSSGYEGMLITFTLQTIFSSRYAQGGGKGEANAVIAFICRIIIVATL